MSSTRMARLSTQFQQEIAQIIHQEVKDPRLGFVTITRVELSKDLSHAKVWYSCLGSAGEREDSQRALDRSGGFVRGLLMRRLRLRTIPEISFRYDPSIEHSITLSQTLESLKEPPKPRDE